MPANKKVSVGWQIVFTFLPVVNFWAFYRIGKLRRYVLYIIVPQIVLSAAIGAYTSDTIGEQARDFMEPNYVFQGLFDPIIIVSYALSITLQGLTIYFIILWSRQHNRQYDQSPAQSS